jgi:hypothetical protein
MLGAHHGHPPTLQRSRHVEADALVVGPHSLPAVSSASRFSRSATVTRLKVEGPGAVEGPGPRGEARGLPGARQRSEPVNVASPLSAAAPELPCSRAMASFALLPSSRLLSPPSRRDAAPRRDGEA